MATSAELKKKIKLAVDAQDWIKVEQYTKEYLKHLDEVNKRLNTTNSILRKNKASNEETDIVNKRIAKNLNEQIIYSDRLLKYQKLINEEKRKGLEEQERREAQRAKWAEGHQTPYQVFTKYKGIEGLGKLAADIASNKTNVKLSGIDKQIAQLTAESEVEGISDEDKAKKLEEIENLKDARAKEVGKGKTQQNQISTVTKQILAASNIIKKYSESLGLDFHNLAQKSLEVATAFLDLKTGIATYDTANSLITNSAAREQQLKYGLSSSQNFAFTQAKSMLNIQSDEDLMYMNSAQREKFLQYMQRYSKWYDQMEASGVLADIQEMQLQFQELKQELGMEFLSWVAANKDTIMVVIKGIFAALLTVADAVLRIVSFFSGGNTTNNTFNINSTVTNNGNQTMTDINVQNQWSSLAKQITTSMG